MEKQQVFFIHGGSPYSNYGAFLNDLRTKEIWDLPGAEVSKKWSSSLRGDLGEQFAVFMPHMPNKQNAHYQEWKIWFERHFQYITNDVILVGYSLGGYFLVKYLMENNPAFTIKALILAAAPFENDTDTSKEDGGDFAFDTSRVGELTAKVASIVLLHSADDFVVPYEHALKYQAALPEAELVTFQDKNHFLVEELPELVQKIQNLA
jgi:predicted alpha/beta hydrolase family esterase